MTDFRDCTQEARDYIKSYAYGHTYKEIADAVNQKFGMDLAASQIRNFLHRYHINTGLSGRFEKGHIPANKGKSMTAEQYKKCSATMFKKGSMPQNHKPVGTVSIRNNYKRGQRYVYEKVAEPNVWRQKHILEWERKYGKVPKGKMLIFADGNTLNVDIDNLVLISRNQNAVMNRWKIHGGNKETAETAANIASLKLKISENKKRAKGAKKK